MKKQNAEAVFQLLYESYAADVFRFVLYLSGNWAAAQDISAETFVRAWTSTSPIRQTTAKAYFFAIARNLCADWKRRQGRLDPLPDMLAACPNLEFEARQELRRTIEDMDQLAEGDRSALAMAVFEEMSHQEIASVLGISTGAVKSRIFRARLRLMELRSLRGKGAAK